VLEVFEGIKANLVTARAFAHSLCKAISSPNSESVNAGTNTGTPFSYADFKFALFFGTLARNPPMA